MHDDYQRQQSQFRRSLHLQVGALSQERQVAVYEDRQIIMNSIIANAISWVIRLLILALVLSAVCFGVLAWRVKPVAAAVCPQCYGFEKSAEKVYVQRGMTDEEQSLVKRNLTLAYDHIREFYGNIGNHPRILICATQECIGRFGGNDAATGSVGSYVLLLGPKGINVIDISHELSLMEVSGRIGLYHSLMGAVPAWFDEGVAVVVSGAPEFTALASSGQNGCRHEFTEDLPADKTKWIEEASEYPFIYAQAGCRVAEWMASRGGSSAVTRLLTRVANGETFERAYAGH
ncbi:MAG: hypothetical protein WBR15_10010 [Gammaproteobacteria bacterium]